MKKSILFVLTLMIISFSLGLSLFFGISFSIEMDRIVQRDRKEILAQVSERMRMLDMLLEVLEEGVRRTAEQQLLQAHRLLLQLNPDPAAWDASLLRQVRDGIEQGELRLINPDLQVAASTREFPGQTPGTELPERIDRETERLLSRLTGSGRVISQRLAASSETGLPQISGYYGPQEHGFILQISIDFNQYMRRQGYEFTPARLFESLLQERTYVRDGDVFAFSRDSQWSLISGERVELDPVVEDALRRNREVRREDGDSLIIYQRRAFFSADNPFGEHLGLMLQYDLGYYQTVLERFYLRGVMITLLLIIISALLVGLVLDRRLVRDVTRLRMALLKASRGGYAVRLPENQRIPEYQEIALAFNQLVAAASQREQDLEQQTERLSSALHQRDILLREIHHRVKNNLQIITSLISIEQNKNPSGEVQDVFSLVNARVRAMAAVHEILYETSNLGGAALDDLIERVYHSVVAVFGLENCACSFSYNVPEILLSVDSAIPLSLILTEAFTNALKYGQRGHSVRLQVSGEVVDATMWQLEIRDNGPGFPADSSADEGFGFLLMRGLAEQLGGRFDLKNDGGAVVLLQLPRGFDAAAETAAIPDAAIPDTAGHRRDAADSDS